MTEAFLRSLAHRLDGDGPLGVAVSGGGDSVALLYRLAAWGRRPLHVFCVDHGLNSASAEWTRDVADHAGRLGAAFTALQWSGVKPKTGVSAAARRARHGLLAEAARARGIRVLCLAHTRDDVGEAAWMRDHGSNVTAPAEWSPSPVWPQGRGIFLLRPLLDDNREALRQELVAQGIGWIDDPANANTQSLRVQARLAEKPFPMRAAPLHFSWEDMGALVDLRWAAHGLIALQRGAFDVLPSNLARKILAAAAVCAGGADRLPRGDSVETLLAGLPSGKPRTLCGARIWQEGGYIHACREAGDIGRDGAVRFTLTGDEEAMWDGRYAIPVGVYGTIEASGRSRKCLNDADRAFLQQLPAAVRGILPVFHEVFPLHGLPSPRLLGQCGETGVDCVNWVRPRFLAACGAVDRESRIGPDLAEL